MKVARLGDSPEIFHSLQGEGVSMGVPSVFLRLAFCNLRCVWCDTAYTWRWDEGEREACVMDVSVGDVAEIVSSFRCEHLVVTGGEPLLQDAELVALLKVLPLFSVEVETNGSLVPSEALAARVWQFNVSPKLSHSGNDARVALKVDSLRWFAGCGKAWFKFVVGSLGDVDEVESVVEQFGLPRDRVLLMPEGTCVEVIEERRRWLAGVCIERGLRLADRLHIHLWGARRGV